MKFRMPYEVQIVNAMLVLLCAMLGLLMFSIASSSVVGGVAAVLGIDLAVRFLIGFIKKY